MVADRRGRLARVRSRIAIVVRARDIIRSISVGISKVFSVFRLAIIIFKTTIQPFLFKSFCFCVGRDQKFETIIIRVPFANGAFTASPEGCSGNNCKQNSCNKFLIHNKTSLAEKYIIQIENATSSLKFVLKSTYFLHTSRQPTGYL